MEEIDGGWAKERVGPNVIWRGQWKSQESVETAQDMSYENEVWVNDVFN